MKFVELDNDKKIEAIEWAMDSVQEIYNNEGINIIVKLDDAEVIQLANDREYEVEEEIINGNMIRRLHLI